MGRILFFYGDDCAVDSIFPLKKEAEIIVSNLALKDGKVTRGGESYASIHGINLAKMVGVKASALFVLSQTENLDFFESVETLTSFIKEDYSLCGLALKIMRPTPISTVEKFLREMRVAIPRLRIFFLVDVGDLCERRPALSHFCYQDLDAKIGDLEPRYIASLEHYHFTTSKIARLFSGVEAKRVVLAFASPPASRLEWEKRLKAISDIGKKIGIKALCLGELSEVPRQREDVALSLLKEGKSDSKGGSSILSSIWDLITSVYTSSLG